MDKEKTNSKKAILRLLAFVIAVGVFAGFVALFGSGLRESGRIAPLATLALLFILIFGLARPYNLFCRRLDSMQR